MPSAIRKELALLAGAAACGSLIFGRKELAFQLGALSAGLRFAPSWRAFSYRDKVVLITGGSRGFGLAMAERLAKEGAQIWLLARDNVELARAHEQLLRIPGASVNTLVTDVTKPEDLARAFRAADERHGRIDMLINNAGSVAAAPLESTEPEDYEAQLNLHLRAVVSATRLILPYFRRARSGRILNISSLGGAMPVPHMSSYTTSKFALAGFSTTAATELRAEGVYVTTAYPGLLRTGSPIQGVFKGDAQKEFAWFVAGDIAPVLSVPADRAAKQVLEAARHGDTTVMVGVVARAGAFFFASFPELFSGLAAIAARALPHAQASGHRTGAGSQGLLASSIFGRAILKRNERYARRWNQEEKFDARKKLNLPPL